MPRTNILKFMEGYVGTNPWLACKWLCWLDAILVNKKHRNCRFILSKISGWFRKIVPSTFYNLLSKMSLYTVKAPNPSMEKRKEKKSKGGMYWMKPNSYSCKFCSESAHWWCLHRSTRIHLYVPDKGYGTHFHGKSQRVLDCERLQKISSAYRGFTAITKSQITLLYID